MNNKADWDRVQNERWYRLPVKHAPFASPNFDWIAFYFSKVFNENKWAVHFYAPVLGHELLTRRDLIPTEPDHSRAGDWYYKLELGPLAYKLPPIVSDTWRRITFIVTSGDRFETAREIKDLLADQAPTGHLFVTLQERQAEFEGHYRKRNYRSRSRTIETASPPAGLYRCRAGRAWSAYFEDQIGPYLMRMGR